MGASFPIFFNSQRSRIRQARADAYIARNDAELNLRTVTNRITELEASLRRYDESLRYYVESALPEAETSYAPHRCSWPTAKQPSRNTS